MPQFAISISVSISISVTDGIKHFNQVDQHGRRSLILCLAQSSSHPLLVYTFCSVTGMRLEKLTSTLLVNRCNSSSKIASSTQTVQRAVQTPAHVFAQVIISKDQSHEAVCVRLRCALVSVNVSLRYLHALACLCLCRLAVSLLLPVQPKG